MTDSEEPLVTPIVLRNVGIAMIDVMREPS
jgi:hypothetical protein